MGWTGGPGLGAALSVLLSCCQARASASPITHLLRAPAWTRRPLKPGTVITIEPGLYIPDRPEFGALRGIGVRLEVRAPPVFGPGTPAISRTPPASKQEAHTFGLIGVGGCLRAGKRVISLAAKQPPPLLQDDVLVTDDGCEVLSAAAPLLVAAVEDQVQAGWG